MTLKANSPDARSFLLPSGENTKRLRLFPKSPNSERKQFAVAAVCSASIALELSSTRTLHLTGRGNINSLSESLGENFPEIEAVISLAKRCLNYPSLVERAGSS